MKTINRVIYLVVILSTIWLLRATVDNAEKKEFSTLVDTIAGTENLNGCDISVGIERSWLLSWAPTGATIRAEKDGIQAQTFISAHTTMPDRQSLGGRYFQYNSDWWGDDDEGKTFLSYMEAVISDSGELLKITVGDCADFESIKFGPTYKNLDNCVSEKKVVSCV